MSKVQTRRSISISKVTYERLRAHCETRGVSMSGFVERLINTDLSRTVANPIPPPPTYPPRRTF